MRAAVALVPPALSLDVAINQRRQFTAVFAGPLPAGHVAACRFVEETSVQSGRTTASTSSSAPTAGYPLDRNLYQAVKGMAAAERVVRPGGTIVMAAECADGTPAGGAFARLLAGAAGPDALDAATGASETDRWQTQVLGRVLRRADVWLHSRGLSDDDVRGAFLRPVADVTDAVAEALDATGSGARLGVLPYGPLTVASTSGDPDPAFDPFSTGFIPRTLSTGSHPPGSDPTGSHIAPELGGPGDGEATRPTPARTGGTWPRAPDGVPKPPEVSDEGVRD